MNVNSGISAKASSHYVMLRNKTLKMQQTKQLCKLTLRALLFPPHAVSVSLNVPWIDTA